MKLSFVTVCYIILNTILQVLVSATVNEYSEIKEFIKNEAKRLGFVKTGFARPDMVDQSIAFQNWLDKNYHEDMKWMENHIEKRLDPRKLMDDCKTIIVFAANYHNQVNYSDVKISRYVLGDDYHIVLKKKLRKLLEAIQQKFPQIEGRFFTDTAPILERYWAQKSGIGWQGKNTNLITRDYGSYIFLAEMLINIELEADQEHADFCGSCAKCLDSCPTNAFVDAYQLNSNKCISYLTIEKRADFSPEESKLIDNNLYGCDICQEVCPWNKFARETEIEEFKNRLHLINKNLDFWSSIDEKTYQQTLKNSAMKRTKLTGIKRNSRAIKSNRI
ncbi:MAG: tRNA epoxyqueuosine(34) reductase QueG [Calditrichaeota bacterium]|nr:tRNA epoxyqueuosine(34) reductase QueG [Calditrichota bacterium]